MARLTEGMSYERYMQLYTAAYNYCISSGMGGASGIAAGAHLVGGELYSRIAQYFQQHLRATLTQLESLSGEALLRYYTAEWERYTNGANFVHRLLIYLNRHWVKHEREEGRTDVYTIYTVCGSADPACVDPVEAICVCAAADTPKAHKCGAGSDPHPARWRRDPVEPAQDGARQFRVSGHR